MASIFKKLDSFAEYPVLAQQYFPDSTFTLFLRHVDIIRDLTPFYRWFQDPQCLLHNSALPEKNGRLIRHYRRSMESTSRKSFLVETTSSVICQFDISLINLHELYFRLPTSAGDCVLTYILTVKNDWNFPFKNALKLQLDYFFSFPEPNRIWVIIPNKQIALQEIFLKTGFSIKSEYTSRQQRYVIFYLKKVHYLLLQSTHS